MTDLLKDIGSFWAPTLVVVVCYVMFRWRVWVRRDLEDAQRRAEEYIAEAEKNHKAAIEAKIIRDARRRLEEKYEREIFAASRKCPCGRVNRANARYCGDCGRIVDEGISSTSVGGTVISCISSGTSMTFVDVGTYVNRPMARTSIHYGV